MRFRSYDSLRLFCTVAEKMSFTAAGEALNMSKGAVSYQIAKLEEDLGFRLFERRHTHIRLTPQGQTLWNAAERSFHQLDHVISDLRSNGDEKLCVGAHSWFIARWLGPRLSDFTRAHPDVALRVEPINTVADLQNPQLDMTVFWCDGQLGIQAVEYLYPSQTVPLANPEIADFVEEAGLSSALREVPLLPDASGMEGWRHWHRLAGFPYAPRHKPVHLPDANSRLQAVISGHGIALLDELAQPELDAGQLVQISEVLLEGYAYFLVPAGARPLSAASLAFREWLHAQTF